MLPSLFLCFSPPTDSAARPSRWAAPRPPPTCQALHASGLSIPHRPLPLALCPPRSATPHRPPAGRHLAARPRGHAAVANFALLSDRAPLPESPLAYPFFCWPIKARPELLCHHPPPPPPPLPPELGARRGQPPSAPQCSNPQLYHLHRVLPKLPSPIYPSTPHRSAASTSAACRRPSAHVEPPLQSTSAPPKTLYRCAVVPSSSLTSPFSPPTTHIAGFWPVNAAPLL